MRSILLDITLLDYETDTDIRTYLSVYLQ